MNIRLGPRGGEEDLPFVWGSTQDLRAEEAEHFRHPGRLVERGWQPARPRHFLNTRGWLRVGWARRQLLDFAWQLVIPRGLRRWRFGWGFETNGYDGHAYGVDAFLGPVLIYLSLTSRLLPSPKGNHDWHIELEASGAALPDVTIFYSLGDGMLAPHRRRRNGVIFVADRIFGRFSYRTRDLDAYDAVIPLPERPYTVRVTIKEALRKRPRSLWTHRDVFADIDAQNDPLPDSGNVDSDFWNGEDATYGMSVKASTPDEVVAAVVQRVLHERLRHGGSIDWMPKDDHRPKALSEA